MVFVVSDLKKKQKTTILKYNQQTNEEKPHMKFIFSNFSALSVPLSLSHHHQAVPSNVARVSNCLYCFGVVDVNGGTIVVVMAGGACVGLLPLSLLPP